jgi:hypothetical protein
MWSESLWSARKHVVNVLGQTEKKGIAAVTVMLRNYHMALQPSMWSSLNSAIIKQAIIEQTDGQTDERTRKKGALHEQG